MTAHPAIDRRSYTRPLKIERSRIHHRLRGYDLRLRLILVCERSVVILLGNHSCIPQSLLTDESDFLKPAVRFRLL